MKTENNDIKISVWCPCYNHEKYIRQCLNGFINQKTTFKFEVIVHDDASTDKSAKIIKEYAEKYPEIIKPIFEKENQFSKNINLEKEFFIPNIKGEYVAFCEGDDYWCNENKLQIQYDYMKQNDLITCFHLMQNIKETGELIQEFRPPINTNNILSIMGGIFPGKYMLYFIINADCKIHVSTLMLNAKEYIQYINHTPEFAKELINLKIGDLPLVSYFAILEKTLFLPYIMSNVRISHEGSYTYMLSHNRQKLIEVINAAKQLYLKLDEYTNHKYKNILINNNQILKVNYE